MPRAPATVLLALLGASPFACADPCPAGDPGASDVNYPLGDAGTVAGVWSLTLAPAVSRTNCVDARGLPDEQWTYTVELKAGDAEGADRARILVDGYLFVDDGAFASADGLLTYETPDRVDSDREGGAVTYRVTGGAGLEDQGGIPTWTGWEVITVVASEDPEVYEGCVFEYEVTGTQACSE